VISPITGSPHNESYERFKEIIVGMKEFYPTVIFTQFENFKNNLRTQRDNEEIDEDEEEEYIEQESSRTINNHV
jgi:hypothetical protein